MNDPVDEWVVQDLREYLGKPLRSVTQGSLDIGTTDESITDDETLTALVGKAKQILGERVKDVRPSRRLTDSASCLVDDEGALSRNLERILRQANRSVPSRPRILELNPKHTFVLAVERIAAEQPEDPRLATWIELLHDQANLAEGRVADPVGVVRRIQSVLDRVISS